jgi:hypothetical protein
MLTYQIGLRSVELMSPDLTRRAHVDFCRVVSAQCR